MCASFDLDLDGAIDLQETFEDLEEDWSDAPTYDVGTNVKYGKFLEFGTEKMPPYPFFRPAIREFQANPKTFVETSPAFGFQSLDQTPNAKTVVKAVAASLANQMERNVTAMESADRSPGTKPDHPKRDTGNLVNDIGFERL